MVIEDVRLERLSPMTAVYFHVSGDHPEETALARTLEWANNKGLTQEKSRLFGRNTYPTDQPEPHGYEYYLTVDENVVSEGDAHLKKLPLGLYAVSRFKNLFEMQEAWMRLMKWVEENEREPVGVSRGENGWVNSGFEELLDWEKQKPPTEWIFDLWLQLKEK